MAILLSPVSSQSSSANFKKCHPSHQLPGPNPKGVTVASCCTENDIALVGRRWNFQKMKNRLPTPEICPVCGEDVPPRALACPECGADHNSGWKEDADGSLGLPDDEFDYDEFVKEEFGGGGKASRISPFWWVTAVVIFLAMVFWFFGR